MAQAGVSGGPSCRTDAASCRWISSGDLLHRTSRRRARKRSRSAACSAASSRICRTVRPTQLTYCVAGVAECAAHPGQQIVAAVEVLAMCEDPREPGAGERRELRQHRLGRTIAVAEEHQPDRRIGDRHAILREVASVSSCRMTKRATCSRSKRANGTSALFGSTTPGRLNSSSPATHAARLPGRARSAPPP